MSFEKAFQYTMYHETGGDPDGGYVNDPRDPGGETKWGISKRSFPNVNIRDLSEGQAKDIYKLEFWNPMKLDRLHDEEVAIELFDTAVNCGVTAAVAIAQKSVNDLNRAYRRTAIREDGKMGPITEAHLNYWIMKDKDALLALMNIQQGIRYLGIIRRSPVMIYALRSWMRRCLPPTKLLKNL